MRAHKRWTEREHRWLVALVAEKKTNREIATIMKRTHCAVHGRVFSHKLRMDPQAVLPWKPPPVVRVTTQDVAEWYALGWRFVGFIPGGLCRMEWRDERPEQRPGLPNIVMPFITPNARITPQVICEV